jgi:selenocysteine lyase/cysteine desulfurase
MALGLDNIAARVTGLAEKLREKLGEISGVTVRDMPGGGRQPRCGIVTFTDEAHDPRAIIAAMREQHINVRVTGVSSTRIDMEQRRLTSMVRASVHYYNTEEEIARFANAVAAM